MYVIFPIMHESTVRVRYSGTECTIAPWHVSNASTTQSLYPILISKESSKPSSLHLRNNAITLSSSDWHCLQFNIQQFNDAVSPITYTTMTEQFTPAYNTEIETITTRIFSKFSAVKSLSISSIVKRCTVGRATNCHMQPSVTMQENIYAQANPQCCVQTLSYRRFIPHVHMTVINLYESPKYWCNCINRANIFEVSTVFWLSAGTTVTRNTSSTAA